MAKRVLIVDDDPTICLLTARILAQDGWEPYAVGSLAEAHQAVGPWDVVVTDIRLPDGDGRTLKDALPGVPVIVISGFPDEAPDLLKPFSLAKLQYAMARAVEAR